MTAAVSDLLIASAGDFILAAGLADFRLGFLSILRSPAMVRVHGECAVRWTGDN